MTQYDIQIQKAAINIVDVIQNTGVQLKKYGKEYSACCPLHQEKTPSFFVDEKNSYFIVSAAGLVGMLLILFVY